MYLTTTAYPADERFGLVSQTRRCSVSVAANVAEGGGRRGSLEFARFVDIAIGAAFDLKRHLLLAQDLEFLKHPHARTLLEEVDAVKRMLMSLARGLRSPAAKPPH